MDQQHMSQGYNKRPPILIIINTLYFLAPFFYYIQVAFKRGISISRPDLIFSFISSYTWILIGSALIVAISLFLFNRIGWFIFIGHSLFVFLANIAALTNLKNTNLLLNIIFQIITVSIAVYFIVIFKKFRTIFFNPRLRWWKSATRYQLNCPAFLQMKDNSIIDVQLSDISKRGGGISFIPGTMPDNLEEAVSLSFEIEGQKFSLLVNFIWQNIATDFAGYKFLLNFKEKVILLLLMHRFNKQELKKEHR